MSMLVDDVILVGRRLKSFIEKTEPMFILELTANNIRSNDLLDKAISTCVEINIDAFILILRYYNTLAIEHRNLLVSSLLIKIDIENIAVIEVIEYSTLSETNKLVFEICYTLAILEGSVDKN